VTPKPPGRTGTAWWRARQRVLDQATHCAICRQPLDFDAPPKSSRSPSVDHIVPVSQTKHLPLDEQRRLAVDPSNLRAVHYGCNASRGAGRGRKPTKATGRRWVAPLDARDMPPMKWSRWWGSPPPQGCVVGRDPTVYFPGDPWPGAQSAAPTVVSLDAEVEKLQAKQQPEPPSPAEPSSPTGQQERQSPEPSPGQPRSIPLTEFYRL
jgi:hypothetical protein